jgi:hypothetical protein
MTLIPDLERDLIDAAARVRPLRRRVQRWVVVAGAVGVAALAGLGLAMLTTEDGTQRSGRQAPINTAPGRQPSSNGPIDPANVTVSVLNGTEVPGRAAAVADHLLAARFRLGTITNSPAHVTKSVVTFTPGHRREARAVAKRLGISQLARMNRETKALAGPAPVVIIIGPDLAQQPPGR